MNATWAATILDLIADFKGELAEVLKASGCREGWLQGELFRRLRAKGIQDVQTNEYPYAGNVRARADLWVPGKMVAEIKVLGDCGFLPKVIDGSTSIQRLRENYHPREAGGRRIITKELVENSLGSSLLWDFKRLSRVEDRFERILLLILQKTDQPDDVGRALHALQMSGQEITKDLGGFVARAWTVD